MERRREKGLDCRGKLICVQGHVARKIAFFFPQMGTEGEAVVRLVLVWLRGGRLCVCCVCACVHVSTARCHLTGLCEEVLQDVRRLLVAEAFK